MATKPSNVFEKIMYEYAKVIADSAIAARNSIQPANRIGNHYWSFVWRTFSKLIRGKVSASSILRENKLMVQKSKECAYCGAPGVHQWEHVFPIGRGGPDVIDNLVLACPKCNRAKGARNPIEWYESQGKNSSHIPRLVMGKMLKLLLAEHGRRGTLSASEYPTGCALKLRNVCAVFTKQFDGNAAKGQSEP